VFSHFTKSAGRFHGLLNFLEYWFPTIRKFLVIYIPAKYHEEMRTSFEGKPMLITCQEAIPENKENE
jgi:hypothetical protein